MTKSEETNQQPNLQTQQSSAFGLSRRQFMGMSAATLAVLALPKSALAKTATNNTTVPALTPPSDLHFYQPNIITSQLNTSNNYNPHSAP